MMNDGSQAISRNKNLIGILGLVVFVFGGIFTCAQSPPDTLSATGKLSSRSTAYGKNVGFWITLKNSSKGNLSDVRLIRVLNGYSLEKTCIFDSKAADPCHDNRAFQNGEAMLTQTLLAGQSLAVSGELRADATHNSETVIIVIGWKDPSVRLEASTTVSLGENQVQNWYERIYAASLEWIKSLAIPVALAVFGLFLNNLSKKRDETRADVEKKREELRHDREREQALRSETWKQMLPVSHGYAAKYYLPVSTAAERAVVALSKSNHRLAFFYFLMVLRRMAATTNEIGGFYFKDLRGEALAAGCVKRFRHIFLGEETDGFSLAMRGSANLLKADGTYEEFEKDFWSDQAQQFTNQILQKAWHLFGQVEQNRDRISQATLYLKGFYAILDYESNRPYEYWYNPWGPKLIVDAEGETLLRNLAAELQFTREEATEYFAEIKR